MNSLDNLRSQLGTALCVKDKDAILKYGIALGMLLKEQELRLKYREQEAVQA